MSDPTCARCGTALDPEAGWCRISVTDPANNNRCWDCCSAMERIGLRGPRGTGMQFGPRLDRLEARQEAAERCRRDVPR